MIGEIEMMKVIKLKELLVIGGTAILLFGALLISNKNYVDKKVVATSAEPSNIQSLSNSKIGWGIKRSDNHEQPDVGTKNKEIMDKYNGIYMGNKEKKIVYLTFDLGYEAGYTSKILEILKNNNVKATFFITAHYVNTQPDLVKQMINEGHIVGNHTVNHKSMPSFSLETINKEVMNLHSAISEKFGYEMKFIRPPKGEYSERTVAYTNTLGYKTVMWSFAYDDWDENKQGREEYGRKKILENVHNGEIMLLHATSKDNANILDDVVKQIKHMGYEFKNIDEFEK